MIELLDEIVEDIVEGLVCDEELDIIAVDLEFNDDVVADNEEVAVEVCGVKII